MLFLQSTKNLAAELKIKLPPVPEIGIDQKFSWHANVIMAGRKKCVLLMNNVSRYSVFIYGLKKDDFKKFPEICVVAIKENLLADGFDLEKVQKYLSKCDSIYFCKTDNRAVLGQMIDMTNMALGVLENDSSIDEVNRFINRVPMLKAVDCYAVDGMAKVLTSI